MTSSQSFLHPPLWLALWLGVSALIAEVRTDFASAPCPKSCFCNVPSRIVYCSRRGLNAIPSGVPNDSLQLNLNGNAFEFGVLRPGNLSGLDELEHLYLSECALTGLEVGAFAGLERLKWLDISNNRIKVIEERTFSGMSLQHLFLNGNRHLRLLPDSFSGLSTTGLYLHDCALPSLPPETLSPLSPHLRYLWLNGNELQGLDQGHKAILSRLLHLRIASNPLRCDCTAVWLKEFYDTHGAMYQGANPPSCLTPAALKGRAFNELTLFELRCRAPMFSHVDADLDIMTSQGHEMTREFDVGAERYRIEKSDMDRQYNLGLPAGGYKVQNFESSVPNEHYGKPSKYETFFEAYPGQGSGKLFGYDTRATAMDKQTSGRTGRLRCVATGEPSPVIFWIEPSGKTTKFNPPPNDDSDSTEAVLILNDLGESESEGRMDGGDMGEEEGGREGGARGGMYICIANNEAGNVTLTLSIPRLNTAKKNSNSNPQSLVADSNEKTLGNKKLLSGDTIESKSVTSTGENMRPTSNTSVNFNKNRDVPAQLSFNNTPPAIKRNLTRSNAPVSDAVDHIKYTHLDDVRSNNAGPNSKTSVRQYTVLQLVAAVLVTHVVTLLACICLLVVCYKVRSVRARDACRHAVRGGVGEIGEDFRVVPGDKPSLGEVARGGGYGEKVYLKGKRQENLRSYTASPIFR